MFRRGALEMGHFTSAVSVLLGVCVIKTLFHTHNQHPFVLKVLTLWGQRVTSPPGASVWSQVHINTFFDTPCAEAKKPRLHRSKARQASNTLPGYERGHSSGLDPKRFHILPESPIKCFCCLFKWVSWEVNQVTAASAGCQQGTGVILKKPIFFSLFCRIKNKHFQYWLISLLPGLSTQH